jgi:hypothetical protein
MHSIYSGFQFVEIGFEIFIYFMFVLTFYFYLVFSVVILNF